MVIGFVLLSHQNPAQLARLVRTLNQLYGDPPIACHHDNSKSLLDPRDFPDNVTFVTPSIKTGWGKFSVVEAVLAALRLLYAKSDPDWFYLLSAADYPIASAAQVQADLAASGVDALIDYRKCGTSTEEAIRAEGPGNPTLEHFEAPGNREMLRDRYIGAELWLPILRLRERRLGRHTIHLPFDSPRHPFRPDFKCYCGDHWFATTRAGARALLDPSPRELDLQRHLRPRAVPEECYYATVLCNRPELTVSRDNRRFARWNGGGAHPALLTAGDIDAMFASGAHFARKFQHGDPVLDRLDAVLFDRVATQA